MDSASQELQWPIGDTPEVCCGNRLICEVSQATSPPALPDHQATADPCPAVLGPFQQHLELRQNPSHCGSSDTAWTSAPLPAVFSSPRLTPRQTRPQHSGVSLQERCPHTALSGSAEPAPPSRAGAHLEAEEADGADDEVLAGGSGRRQHGRQVVDAEREEEQEAEQVAPDVDGLVGEDEEAEGEETQGREGGEWRRRRGRRGAAGRAHLLMHRREGR